MLSKIISIRKTPILYFEFPYEKIDPLPFQLRYAVDLLGTHEIHVAASDDESFKPVGGADRRVAEVPLKVLVYLIRRSCTYPVRSKPQVAA